MMTMMPPAPLSLHLASPHLAHSWFAAAAEFSRAASGGLVDAIWQGVLLAGLAALTLRLLPGTPAAARFAIWFGVFALIIALPCITFVPHAAAAALSRHAGHAAWLTLDARWTLAIAAVWALASLVRACTLVAAALRVRSLWKRATPVAFAGMLPESRRAQVCASDDVDRPTVIGFFSPRILIPRWLLEKLTPAELEQVVLHEAGHLGRADDWMNLLQKIALVLFPLNPALAWVERRLCFERELACDERVLHALDVPAGRESAATGYASCLTTLAEYRLQRRGLVQGLALALGALGRESELGRRVRRILTPAATMHPLHTRLVMGGAMLVLLFAATELERCPRVIGFQPVGFAQPAADREIAQASAKEQGSVAPDLHAYHAVSLRVLAEPAPVSKTAAGTSPRTGETPSSATRRVATSAVHAINAVYPAPSREPGMVRSLAQRRDTDDGGQRIVTHVTLTEWQSADGSRTVARMVRTSDIVSNAPQTRDDSNPSGRNPDPAARQLSGQDDSPYAAVPVPGGWLVFQL